MRLIDANALEEILDKIPARNIENADGRAYVLVRLSTVFEIIKQMPSAQPEIIRCKDCKYRDENWRRVSVGWLLCMDVRTGSNWYCGSAERGEQDDEQRSGNLAD